MYPPLFLFAYRWRERVGGTLFFSMCKVGGTVGGTPFFMHKVGGTVGGTLFHPICEVGDCYYFLRAVKISPKVLLKGLLHRTIWDDSW